MKQVYFVRHGESEGNVGPIVQDKTMPLTEKGKAQARFVAKRCASLPIEVMVSSTMVRARETADFISKEISIEPEFSDLFVERRRPSFMFGKAKDSSEVLAAGAAIWDNFAKQGFRHSDEENFDDLKDRARQALEYLEKRPEEHILVVTHGFFMRIVAAYMVYGKDLTGEECEAFIRTFHMENTGLSVFGYDEKKTKSPWWLWIWNDHAHLGDVRQDREK